ncbi:MAG: hypothetical protein DRP27_09615, partial [Thermotogae bacterium]
MARMGQEADNVVLITIDSLRADRLSRCGYHRETTPRLDELSREGFLFAKAFSNSSWTVPSFSSILASSYPLEYPFGLHLSPERLVLPEVLRDHGYTTAGINCLPYLSRFFGYDRGFDTFEDFLYGDYGVQEVIGEVGGGFAGAAAGRVNSVARVAREVMSRVPVSGLLRCGLEASRSKLVARRQRRWHVTQFKRLASICGKHASASVLNEAALSWLKENAHRNFFLWIHYVDVHIPYKPSSAYMRRVRTSPPREREVRALNEKLFKYRSTYDKAVE